jgi:hypothetical protein
MESQIRCARSLAINRLRHACQPTVGTSIATVYGSTILNPRKALQRMRLPARLQRIDDRSWAAATWSAPFTMELVTGLLALVLWALRPTDHAGSARVWFLTGVLFTAALSALMSAIFCRSSSWQLRGVGLSLAGSAAILVPVGIVVAFLLYS